MTFLWFILIGLFAGAIAGTLVKGSGFGVVGDILIGVLGAVLGGILFNTFGAPATNGLLGSLIVASVGSVVLLFGLRIVKAI